MRKVYLILLVIAIQSSQAIAGETVYNHFAECTGLIDSIPITLDFFEELGSNNESLTITGKGLFIQTMGLSSEKSMKMMGQTALSKGSKKSFKKVEMYAIIQPSILFSTFEMDLKNPSEVEIYAHSFRAVWGKFTCNPR